MQQQQHPKDMTIRELKEEAATLRISVTGILDKDELVKAVQDARAIAAAKEASWWEAAMQKGGSDSDDWEESDEDDEDVNKDVKESHVTNKKRKQVKQTMTTIKKDSGRSRQRR